MENSQSLATESFSYSWLTTQHPPPCSRRPSDHLFNFDFPLASPQNAPVHADEIFSGGHIMPVFVDRPRTKNSKSAPPSPAQLAPTKNRFSWEKSKSKSFRGFFGGIFAVLKPLIGCTRTSNRVDDFDRAEFEASPRPSSSAAARSRNSSPRRSPSSYCGDNSRSCDMESSIHEAILYCKKSIEA